MINDLKEYYLGNGIHSLNFTCKHKLDCSIDTPGFTGPKSTYIGKYYKDRVLPRLLILSLDSGSGDPDPNRRTPESVRLREETESNTAELPKHKHWYRTHETAHAILNPFSTKLDITEVKFYFVHVNSVKCSMNRPKREMAKETMYFNCRWFIPRELEILDPDIIVTQGKMARESLYGAFSIIENPNSSNSDCPFAIIEIHNNPVYWIMGYHPNERSGKYHKQFGNCMRDWKLNVVEFMRKKRDWGKTKSPEAS